MIQIDSYICLDVYWYNPTMRAMTVAFNYKLSALYVPQILRADDEITAIKPTAITNGVL